MPALSDYTAGTITLTNGSVNFTGAGTGWQAADFREGDTILGIEDNAGVEYVIASITGNGAGTLTQEWEGATGTYQYRMRYMADGARVTAQARNLIELLGNGNLQAEAGIDGTGGNWLSYFTGAGTKARTALTAFARTLLDDVDAATMRATLSVVAMGVGPNQLTNLVSVGHGVGGPRISVDSTDFGRLWTDALGAASFVGGNGWFRLPNNFLVQFGASTGTTNSGGALVTTFPTAFANTSYKVVAWNDDHTVGGYCKHFQGSGYPSTTQFAPIVMNDWGTVRAGELARIAYIAIGQ